MARIIDIPEGADLYASLAYFARQLPPKEVGWVELFGPVSQVQVGSAITLPDGDYTLVGCVCVLSSSKVEVSGFIVNEQGQTVYSGLIRDLVSKGITGRLSTLPKAPWRPDVNQKQARPSQKHTTTTTEQKVVDVTWASLANNPDAPERREEITQAPKAPPMEIRAGDVLLHPRFGRCRVVRAPAFGKLKVRRPNGSFTDLHMKVLEISRIENVHGERLVHLQIKPAQK